MKNVETKCHRFWLNNLNPITMVKDEDPAYYRMTGESTNARTLKKSNKFNFNNQ